jgi:hypothetical protein
MENKTTIEQSYLEDEGWNLAPPLCITPILDAFALSF